MSLITKRSRSKVEATSIVRYIHVLLLQSNEIYMMRFYTGPADALAEFVDNSIQYHSDRPCEISISLQLAGRYSTGSSYIVISDNGRGMTVSAIKAFATFALDQRARDLTPSVGDTGRFISKFGVGAKQAGFYLGKNINIFTKSEASNKLLNFVMV